MLFYITIEKIQGIFRIELFALTPVGRGTGMQGAGINLKSGLTVPG